MGIDAAIPGDLIGFSGWAQQQDQTLLAVGRNINDAIEAFNAMPQNPRYAGPLPYIGDDLASLSARMSTVDEWIGTVGKAFQQGGGDGTGANGGDGWTSLPDATLMTMVTAAGTAPQSPPPPRVQPGPSPSPLPKPRPKSGPGWKNYLEAAGWFALAGITGAIGAYYLLDVAGVFVLYATVDLAAPEGAPVEIPVEAVTGGMSVLVIAAATIATYYFTENGLHALDPSKYPAPKPLPPP